MHGSEQVTCGDEIDLKWGELDVKTKVFALGAK